MKKRKNEILTKALVLALVGVIWLVSAKVIYSQVRQSLIVDPTVVATYQPYLNVSLVKKAALVFER